MKILVVNGHPRSDSFCGALADAYVAGAREAGHEVDVLLLSEMNLEPYIKLRHSSINPASYPAEMTAIHDKVLWADHYVFAYPIWWGLPPALLKVFFEVAFAPKIAFKYVPPKNGVVRWEKLLTGRTAQLLVTADAPPWYVRYVRGAADERALKRSILGFCGVTKIKAAYFGSVKVSTPQQREKWLASALDLGRRARA
jgi:putative NADPH-quinone reductase